jgi:hypothetical protein
LRYENAFFFAYAPSNNICYIIVNHMHIEIHIKNLS